MRVYGSTFRAIETGSFGTSMTSMFLVWTLSYDPNENHNEKDSFPQKRNHLGEGNLCRERRQAARTTAPR